MIFLTCRNQEITWFSADWILWFGSWHEQ